MDGIRSTEVTFPKSRRIKRPITLKVAVAHEIRNARKILDGLRQKELQLDFVEVMACPGGCLGGGGQPIPTNAEVRKKRMQAIYARDKILPIRKSHENPAVQAIYQEFLQEPGSQLTEKLLHTKYYKWSK
jgi:iron only hydrogenase large subunit-like protein